MNFFKRIISKCISCYYIFIAKARPSFAQVGEDSILYYLFHNSGMKNISYLDIGTNHPVYGNNTYAFYLFGGKGVCVEPDPSLFTMVKKIRKNDTCLQVGIGLNEQSEADFYVFSNSGWNTFSAEEASLRKASGMPYDKVLKIPLKNINDIIATHFSSSPDLISIDVEGLDFEILKSLDFNKYAPKVLVIETLRFGETSKAMKHEEMIDFVRNNGYFVYADTHVNTIFCKNNFFNK